jgi:hypothetical protein
MPKLNADYVFHLAMGSHALAQRLAQLETDAERKKHKLHVVEKKTELLKSAYPDELGKLEDTVQFSALPSRLGQHEDEDTRRTLLIDLMFSDPFAPYELKYVKKDMDSALVEVAGAIGLSKADVTAIRATQAAAARAHVARNTATVLAIGTGVAAVAAITAVVATPAIGGIVGTAAYGLYGAAATNAGLALLGGGSLAAGGFGMAGGMWVIAGAGAAVGLAGGGGTAAMVQLGIRGTKAELIKLQVTYKEVLLRTQAEVAKAQEVTKDLAKRQGELREQLAEERDLNDRNAQRLKNLEDTIEAVGHSLAWMKKQRLQ